MFTRARIKLTSYYLTIIMFVSLLFSVLAYRGFVYEIWRGLRLQGDDLPPRVLENIKEEVYNQPAPLGILYGPARLGQIINQEIYEEARNRVIVNLLYINLAVMVVAGVGGYLLAGITLKPIEEVLDEQKRFVSDASHELRTPLTSLKTEIEVALRNKKLSIEEAKTILTSNLTDVDKIQSLTSYLLTLSRFETRQDKSYEQVNLKNTAESVIKKINPIVKKKRIKLSYQLNDASVHGNAMALNELILILLDNAVKYTNSGGNVFVTLTKTSRGAKIKITDSGIGISEQDIKHIFDRFYRANQSRSKEEVDGFGLGLSIAKKIVDIHKGSIKVESKIGKGSTFCVHLPK